MKVLIPLLAISPIALSSCSSYKYQYSFPSYSPTEYFLYGEKTLNYFMPTGVGWPKSEKTNKSNKYLIRTYLSKDGREQQQPVSARIVLYRGEELLSCEYIGPSELNEAIIKQKDFYKNYIIQSGQTMMICNVLWATECFPFGINYAIYHTLYDYRKSDFKIIREINLCEYFKEDYEGDIYIKIYGLGEPYSDSNDRECANIITKTAVHSWHLDYNKNNSSFHLTSYQYKAVFIHFNSPFYDG